MAAKPRGVPEGKAAGIRTALAVAGVALSFSAYNYVFPHGPLNALTGLTPSLATEACVGMLKSPFCYVAGWTAGEEPPLFNITYREARLRVLAQKHGIKGEVSLAGSPSFSEDEDVAGYRHWLSHASEAEFDQVLLDFDRSFSLRQKEKVGQ